MKTLCYLSILFSIGGYLACDQAFGQAPEYDRDEFRHWISVRDRALIVESLIPVERVRGGMTGLWRGPYGGDYLTSSRQVDYDHVVPLAWAWANGAHAWSETLRMRFANDPENLILVAASLNRAKGARGPDEWLPPLGSYRCEYLLRWAAVLESYDLPGWPGREIQIAEYCGEMAE